jgi:hypothetical protein
MWDLWWDKVALGRFSPTSSVSPAIVVRSTNYSTITEEQLVRKNIAHGKFPYSWLVINKLVE